MKKIIIIAGVCIALTGCKNICQPSLYRRIMNSSDTINHIKEVYVDSKGQKMMIVKDTLLNVVVRVTPVKE